MRARAAALAQVFRLLAVPPRCADRPMHRAEAGALRLREQATHPFSELGRAGLHAARQLLAVPRGFLGGLRPRPALARSSS